MSQTTVVTLERPHDYLYDRIYQVSGERDHARATILAASTSQQVYAQPIYDSMFSELRHYPRAQYAIGQRDVVPRFVSRAWYGIKQNNERNVEVGGQDRFRYFRRPIIPYATQLPPDVILDMADTQKLVSFVSENTNQAPVRSVACQTIFRDSQTQTDPYSPDYIVRPGEAPEVLTLASLTYGHGLPGGVHAVEMLERARHRRELEAALPPINDLSQSEKRQKMMDEIETEEWRVREQQIEELQQLRLGVLIKLLKQREDAHQELSNRKLDRLWNRKQTEKEKLFHTLRLKHVKALRQLMKRFKNVENKCTRREIIEEYTDPASQTWAPLTRIGQFIDRAEKDYLAQSPYLNTYNGLLELEESLPKFTFKPKINTQRKAQTTKSGFKKREFREEEALKKLYESIKENVAIKDQPEKPLKYLEKIEKPVPRPPTPTVSVPEENEEEAARAVIFIQQILRGRAVQAMMFEGKEKRKELIEEIRSTHSLLGHEAEIDKAERAKILNLQRQKLLLDHRESKIEEELNVLEGESMAETFDFLSKELIRLQEERRTHAIYIRAERERRIKEAEESGLRQLEERRRQEHDEMFKQIIKVHQTTVDQYLEDIINQAFENTASDVADIETEMLAKVINDQAYYHEANNTPLEQQGIVGDIVHNFLIPEVYKQTVQEDIAKRQHKYLTAAHRDIVKEVDELTKPQESVNQGDAQNVATITDENFMKPSDSPDSSTKSPIPSPDYEKLERKNSQDNEEEIQKGHDDTHEEVNNKINDNNKSENVLNTFFQGLLQKNSPKNETKKGEEVGEKKVQKEIEKEIEKLDEKEKEKDIENEINIDIEIGMEEEAKVDVEIEVKEEVETLPVETEVDVDITIDKENVTVEEDRESKSPVPSPDHENLEKENAEKKNDEELPKGNDDNTHKEVNNKINDNNNKSEDVLNTFFQGLLQRNSPKNETGKEKEKIEEEVKIDAEIGKEEELKIDVEIKGNVETEVEVNITKDEENVTVEEDKD